MALIECLLWDFGDTLCDERFIWNSAPEWVEIYETLNSSGLTAQWFLGNVDTRSIAETIARILNRTESSVVAHMNNCCKQITFFNSTYEFFRSQQLPQAIVTVNPDIFSEVIVPFYNLQDYCGTIVTSWEERTMDKRILNKLAIERLGLDCEKNAALLIDNKKSNIDDWIASGGAGYHYVDDDTFARNVSKRVDLLASLK